MIDHTRKTGTNRAHDVYDVYTHTRVSACACVRAIKAEGIASVVEITDWETLQNIKKHFTGMMRIVRN